MYVFVSVSGFLTYPVNPPDLIIYRKNVVFDSDIFMTVAKLAMAADLFLCLPVNYNSFRLSFSIQFLQTADISKRQNFFLTTSTLILCTLIGALYKDILSYISLLGGFCSSIICFLIPFTMKIKTNGKPLSSCENLFLITITVILVSLGFLGGIQTIREQFTK